MAATLLKTKCPNCSAPIRIDTNAESVTCEFCSHSSLLQKRGQQPTRNAKTMHFGTINVDAAQRARRVLLFVILGVTLLPIVGIGTCVAVVLRGASSVTRGFRLGKTSDDKATKKYKAKLKAMVDKAFRKGRGGTVKVKAADLKRVDGLELLLQARAAALKVDAHVKLSSVYFPRLVGGMVDVAAGDRASFSFGYKYNDPKKPAGEDGVKGRVDVSLYKGILRVRRISMGTSRFMPMPGCSTKAMWAAVVKSGVPANAIARVFYRRRGFRKSRTIWTIDIAGHREYRRTVDGQTCKVRRRR